MVAILIDGGTHHDSVHRAHTERSAYMGDHFVLVGVRGIDGPERRTTKTHGAVRGELEVADSAAVERELSADDDEKVQVEFFVLLGAPAKAS